MQFLSSSPNRGTSVVLGQIPATTITLGGLSACICAIAIGFYSYADQETKDILKFATATLATAAGVTSASYIGHTLTANHQSQLSTALEHKNNRTLLYISRWSDSGLPKSKAIEILTSVSNSSGNKKEFVHQQLQDSATKQEVVSILCFFEEMALAIKTDLVHEDILYGYYKEIVSDYLMVFRGWIMDRRVTNNDQSLYCEFTELHEKWANNHQPAQSKLLWAQK